MYSKPRRTTFAYFWATFFYVLTLTPKLVHVGPARTGQARPELISFTNLLANNFHHEIKQSLNCIPLGVEPQGAVVYFMGVYIVECNKVFYGHSLGTTSKYPPTPFAIKFIEARQADNINLLFFRLFFSRYLWAVWESVVPRSRHTCKLPEIDLMDSMAT